MRVFVFEYLTALGIGRDTADPRHAMYREGRAMREAVAEDFGRIPGSAVKVMAQPADDPETTFRSTAGRCDFTLVIAPESDGLLARYCREARQTSSHVLNPSAEAVELTSDKLALATHWRERGVRTPATTDRPPTRCEAFPVVWKPRDGAGSTATFLLRDAFEVVRATRLVEGEESAGPMILQEFVPGTAASVAFLCGPAGNVPLLPTFQHLSDDGRFQYRGGELPFPPDLAARAVQVATHAVGCVGGLKGYVGIDVILGDAADGSRDYAVEINPRLTTSYVGLRALADFNLAAAMLAVAAGESHTDYRWRPGHVRFTARGTISGP